MKKSKSFYGLVLEILIILTALSGFSFFASPEAFFLLQAVFFFAYFYFLFKSREVFGRDFAKYFLFFAVIFVFIEAFWYSQFFFSGSVFERYYSFILLLLAFFAFVFLFRLLLGRNYSNAKVLLSGNGIAVLETDFDLLSFSLKGRHVINCGKKLKPNSLVKIFRPFYSKKFKLKY